MAETENKGFIAKIVDAIKGFVGKKEASTGADGQNLRDKVEQTATKAKGEGAEQVAEVSSKLADKAKGIGGQLKGMGGNLGSAKEAFGEMGKGNKATAVGGAAFATQGAVSTMKSVKNKQFGRAAFAAARTAIGAVATVAAFKAQSNNQNIGEFAQSVLNSRKGGAAKTGPQV